MQKLTRILLLVFMVIGINTELLAADTYQSIVDTKGNISLPKNYKTQWSFLGSFFVKNSPEAGMTDNSEASFDAHTVYTQPETVSYFRKHGKFPDGAVLVKEVNGTNKENMTTGEVRYKDVDTAKVIFVMVKDQKNRFSDNLSWGEGWGWALFNPGENKSQTTNWKGEGFNNCYGCHVPVKNQDWVYTQGYKSVLTK